MNIKTFYHEEVREHMWKKIKAWLNWEVNTDDDVYQQIVLWILPYQARLNGNNRFLISPEIIHEAFPEFSRQQVLDVWFKLTNERKYVDTDPFDNAWVVKSLTR